MSSFRAKLEQRFDAAWRERPLSLQDAEPLLLLSGGSDSTALLMLLHRLGTRFRCRHFVHRSDSEFSLQARRFCEDLCARLRLPLEIEELDIPAQLASGDGSWEAAARTLRYRSAVNSTHLTLTGHTADDQAETVLLGLLTGRGPSGLGGVHPVRKDGLFRPLLGFRRTELQRYLEEIGQPWLSDPTNRDGNLRAQVRHQLLPTMSRIQPQTVERLAQFADLLRADEAHLRMEAQAGLARARQARDCWSVQALAELSPPLRYRALRLLWDTVVPPGRRPLASLLEQAERLLLEGGDDRGVDFPGGGGVRRLGQRVWLRPPDLPEPLDLRLDRLLEDSLPPYLELLPYRPEAHESALLFGLPPADQRAAYRVRARRPGDRFGPRQVKKLLAGGCLPPWVRDRAPLLIYEDRVVAVPGAPYRVVGGDAEAALVFRPNLLRAKGP